MLDALNLTSEGREEVLDAAERAAGIELRGWVHDTARETVLEHLRDQGSRGLVSAIQDEDADFIAREAASQGTDLMGYWKALCTATDAPELLEEVRDRVDCSMWVANPVQQRHALLALETLGSLWGGSVRADALALSRGDLEGLVFPALVGMVMERVVEFADELHQHVLAMKLDLRELARRAA